MSPTSLIRARISACAIMLALAACSKPQDQAGQNKAAGPHGPVALSYKSETDDVHVNLSLPEALSGYPDLHARLFDEGRTDLQGFAATAGKDHADLAQQGYLQPPYSRTITWSMTAQSDDLMSLYAHVTTDEGGAHPNAVFQTVVWDRKANRSLTPGDLFAKDADLKDINAVLCHTLEAERSKRIGKPISQGGNCPRIEDAQMVLLPSRQPGKIGGIALLYAPYSFGAYAEGGYEVRLGQGLVRAALKPDFAADFGGEPAPEPLLPASPQYAAR